MNIFYLSSDPQLCAEQHCDSHVVKMILEYAQMLSTAHRVLDGQHTVVIHKGRKQQQWIMSENEELLYKGSHVNHPDNIWIRASSENYKFLYKLFMELCKEYTHRYGKIHVTHTKLAGLLANVPKNIPIGQFTEPPLSMPDEYKVDDAVTAYQNLYVGSKARFAKWTNRKPPEWFIQRTPDYDQAHFERTR